MIATWSHNDIISSLSKLGKYKDKGDEFTLEICPYCGKNGHKFTANIEKQVFHCYHENACGKSGTLYKLFSDNNVLPIANTAKTYKKPKPDSYIVSSDTFLSKYQSERKISVETLKKYSVSHKTINGNEFIVYRYFDENKVEINRKYRNFNDKTNMWTEKDAEHIYYGLDHINFNDKRLIVVSGEDDVHALKDIGFVSENVVSVPYGDKAYTDSMRAINERFPEIILMFDADTSGQAGALQFAQKAGVQKCKNVILPYKDARDCLQNGIDYFNIQKEIASAKNFEMPVIVSFPQGSIASEVEESLTKTKKGFIDSEGMLDCRIISEDIEETWLVDKVLAQGICGFLYGEGGSFKSLAALWLVMQRACVKIDSTQKWLGKFPINFGKSIFFSAEDMERDITLRTKDIIKSMSNARPDISKSAFIDALRNCRVFSQDQWITADTPFIVNKLGERTSMIDTISTYAKDFNADLIILETSRRIAPINENDNELATRVVNALEEIRRATGATVLCIAHTSKNSRSGQTDTHGQNGLCGAGAYLDNSRFGIWFKAMKNTEEGKGQIEVVNSKTFRCKRFEPFTIEIDYPEFKVGEKNCLKTDLFETVVQYVKDNAGCKKAAMRKDLKINNEKLGKTLNSAISEGLIELRGKKNNPEGYFYVG